MWVFECSTCLIPLIGLEQHVILTNTDAIQVTYGVVFKYMLTIYPGTDICKHVKN